MKRPASYRVSTVFVCSTALAALVSLIYLRASQVTGRLAQELAYDDNGYAVDAIERLGTGYRDGFLSMLATLWNSPPHSPWSTLLATIGLSVGGFNEFSLYSANSILLIAVTFFLALAFRVYGWAILSLAIGSFLLSPLAYRAIFDFRPDLALGFITASMVWWFAHGFGERKRQPFTSAGIALGLALWIKPTFFVHTLLLACALVGLCFAVQWLSARIPIRFQWHPGREGLRFLAIGLVIFLPYFLFNGQDMFEYFWTNTRGGRAHIWSFSDTLPLRTLVGTFLFDRQFSFRVLGYHLFFAISAIVISSALIFFQGRKQPLAVIAILCSSALFSLIVIIAGKHHNEFFLASFQSLILLASLYSIAEASVPVAGAARRLWFGLWFGLLLIAIFLNQGLVHWSIDPETRWSSRWNERIVQSIRSHLDASSVNLQSGPLRHRPEVFVSFAGVVNFMTLQWTAAKLGLDVKFSDLPLSDSLPEYMKAIEASDYLVLPNQESAGYYRWLPSAAIQSVLAERFLLSPDWKAIPSFSPSDNYYVLASTRFINQIRPVLNVPGLKSATGFLSEEGPYPQWSLPRVRWMSSRGQICWYGNSDTGYEISAELGASAPGTVKLSSSNSSEQVEVNVKPGSFAKTTLSMRAPVGAVPCVSLDSDLLPVKDSARMVLLKRFSVEQNR